MTINYNYALSISKRRKYFERFEYKEWILYSQYFNSIIYYNEINGSKESKCPVLS
jgi:hypothetical protein